MSHIEFLQFFFYNACYSACFVFGVECFVYEFPYTGSSGELSCLVLEKLSQKGNLLEFHEVQELLTFHWCACSG